MHAVLYSESERTALSARPSEPCKSDTGAHYINHIPYTLLEQRYGNVCSCQLWKKNTPQGKRNSSELYFPFTKRERERERKHIYYIILLLIN